MSLPTFPPIEPPLSREGSINEIISSIAAEELSLSHILNAEGEKLQYVLGTLPGLEAAAALDEVMQVNQSVQETLSSVMEQQMLLTGKLASAMSAPILPGAHRGYRRDGRDGPRRRACRGHWPHGPHRCGRPDRPDGRRRSHRYDRAHWCSGSHWPHRSNRGSWPCRGCRSHWSHRSHRGYGPHRSSRSYRSHRSDRFCRRKRCRRSSWHHRRGGRGRGNRSHGGVRSHWSHRSQPYLHRRLCRQHPGQQRSGGAGGQPNPPAQRPSSVPRHHGQHREHGVYRGHGGHLSDILPCEYHCGPADGNPAGDQRGEQHPLYHQPGGLNL